VGLTALRRWGGWRQIRRPISAGGNRGLIIGPRDRGPVRPSPIGGLLITTKPAAQVLHKPLGDELRHQFVGVVNALAGLESESEGDRRGGVIGRGGRQIVGRVGR
jgi:hypothetical protein